MATVTFDSPRSSLDTYRSVRSKAKPKHTLFGTSLEAFTDGEREHIHNIDVNKYINTYTPYVSTDLSTRLQDYENQKMRVQQAAEEYKASQAKALNFRTTPPPSSDKHRKPNDSQTLMELMNPDPPRQTNKIKQHQYKIMGDVFSSNNNQEMGIIRERQPQDSPRYGRRSSAKNIGFDSDFLVHYNPAQVKNTNENCNNDTSLVAQEKPKSIVPLPANIRHSFGSRMCDELLSDVDKVSGTLERQRQDRAPRRRIQEEIPTLLETPLNEYHDLGHKTRLNLFPGLSRDNKISVTQTNFNDSVHLQRVPVTDKYRMQRDELSQWSEHNLLREKQKEKWKEYHDSLPKQTVNWDRSATRPKPQPQTVPTAVKKKSKPIKTKVESSHEPIKEEAFEDFVFKTPPLTPPPTLPSPGKLPQSFEKDDDFWEFFDQELPK